MIYDLNLLDFSEEITNQLKKQHSQMVEELLKEKSSLIEDNNDFITLYHGTSIRNLICYIY